MVNPAEKFLTSISAMAEDEKNNDNNNDKNQIVYIPWGLIREVNKKTVLVRDFHLMKIRYLK